MNGCEKIEIKLANAKLNGKFLKMREKMVIRNEFIAVDHSTCHTVAILFNG